MNTRRISNAEFFDAKLYRRIDNSNEYEKVAIHFKAKFHDPHNSNKQIPLTGVISSEVRLALYTSELKVKIKIQDKIIILQDEYLVDSVALELRDSPYVLGASRFSKFELENKLPKVIRLV